MFVYDITKVSGKERGLVCDQNLVDRKQRSDNKPFITFNKTKYLHYIF